MAVDQSLIRGAYEANAPVGVPGVREVQRMTESITGDVVDYMKYKKDKADKDFKRQEKSDKELQKYIDKAANANDLGLKERKRFTDQFSKYSEEFADASPQRQSEMIAEIQKEAEDTRRAFDIYNNIGVNANKDGDINSRWLNNEGKAWVNAAVNPNITLEKNEEGDYGWKVNGEFKTLAEFEKEIEKNRKDKGFSKGILAINENARKRSSKNTDVKFTKFNRINVGNQVENLLTSEGANLISIATDPMLGAESTFEMHVKEALVGRKYEALVGGDYNYDIDGDGVIDQDEANNIFEHLLKPENKQDLTSELKSYFTEVIERRGWSAGVNDRVTTVEEEKDLKTQYKNNPELRAEVQGIIDNAYIGADGKIDQIAGNDMYNAMRLIYGF